MRVGFVYNVRSAPAQWRGDEDAEFDAPETIEAIRDAIASHGHDVVGLEADRDAAGALVLPPRSTSSSTSPKAEARAAARRRCPRCSTSSGIPYTGSDAVALGVSLDKSAGEDGRARRRCRNAALASS